jgi:myo-inositol 2-dehydrogenase/D-chiro-inositol 1-dehydrogenase
VRVALIGCGRMGRRHAEACSRTAAVDLVATYDPVVSLPRAVGSLEEAIARADGVIVAVPTPLHAEVVAACIDAGRHVLCEKPLTFDPALDLELGQRAEEAGVTLVVGYWRRVAWPYAAARRLLDDGVIGDPRFLRLCQWDASPPPVAFCDPAVSGGIEVDCGVHEMDLVRWLLRADVARVAAAGGPSGAEIEAVGDVEVVAGVGATVGGHAFTIDLARCTAYDDDVRTELVGERGALLVRSGVVGSLHVGTADGLRAAEGPAGDVLQDALVRQLAAFADGGRGLARAADDAHALAAAQALRAARLTGAWEIARRQRL